MDIFLRNGFQTLEKNFAAAHWPSHGSRHSTDDCGLFITVNVQFCVPHYGRRCVGAFALGETCITVAYLRW